MAGIDDQLAQLGTGGSLVICLLVAILLGLRHATDPDHLTAVSALVAGEGAGARRASRLGLAWGAGHATTLLISGLPVVLFRRMLPETVHHAAELAIGAVIVVLSVRLLLRSHRRAVRASRSPRTAFGIGLVHGLGGSAGVGLLLIGAMPDHSTAVAALVLFAVATATAMWAASAAWGMTLTSPAVERRLTALTPVLAAASLAFGAWYGAVALG